MSSTIVVGYIPSPEGVAALAAAKNEAVIRGANIVVVNTGHHGDYADPAFATAKDIEAIDKELTEAGIAHEVRQPTSGLSAAEELLAAAEWNHATLIVVGVRRRSPVGKLFMGSTSQHVLLDAPCAVLAVKAPQV